jgi:hypothetical protein
MSATPKFVLVVFDGLRRDMIRPDLAPNLCRFLASGSDFRFSRSVFPTSTRVNAAALATGTVSGTHGIIANEFYDPKVFPDRAVSTGKITDIECIAAAYGGDLVSAVSLGEVVADAGLRVVVVSTGTAGTTRLVNPKAKELGQVSLCLRAWDSSTPADFARSTIETFGSIPPAARPNLARIRMQTKIFVEHVFPTIQPDVSVLWYSDPDSTYHYCGIGSAESRRAIENVDAEFGRLLDWWRSSKFSEQIQIFVLSDHGHITARHKVNVKQQFSRSGLHFASHCLDDTHFTGSLGYTGGLWVSTGNLPLMTNLTRWLLEQPWCGMIFTADGNDTEGCIPGTLARSLLMANHTRAPQIYFIMRTDDDPDVNGIEGGCYFDGEYPEGGSTHGGLHLKELNNLLAVQGSLFRQAYCSNYPAGIIDVAPTILHLLRLRQPPGMSGRVLSEALIRGGVEPPEPEILERRVDTGSRQQRLQFARVGSTLYLNAGWVEG